MGHGSSKGTAGRRPVVAAALAGFFTACCLLRAPGGMELLLRVPLPPSQSAPSPAAPAPLPSPYVALCLSAKGGCSVGWAC